MDCPECNVEIVPPPARAGYRVCNACGFRYVVARTEYKAYRTLYPGDLEQYEKWVADYDLFTDIFKDSPDADAIARKAADDLLVKSLDNMQGPHFFRLDPQ